VFPASMVASSLGPGSTCARCPPTSQFWTLNQAVPFPPTPPSNVKAAGARRSSSGSSLGHTEGRRRAEALATSSHRRRYAQSKRAASFSSILSSKEMSIFLKPFVYLGSVFAETIHHAKYRQRTPQGAIPG